MKKVELFKECAKCELILPESKFWADNIKATKLQSYCIPCHNEYNKHFMRAQREKERG
jgi:hypothetical protein